MKIGNARFVAEQSVQLHGAMGVTEELDIGSISNSCSPSTPCSAAAPITIAVTPRAGIRSIRTQPERGNGSHLQRRRTGFRSRSPRIHRPTSPEMKRAQALTPSVFSDPEIGIAWQKSLHEKGWGAPGWHWNVADRLDGGAALDFRGRVRPRRHACGQRDGRQDGQPRHHRVQLANRRTIICRAFSPARTTGVEIGRTGSGSDLASLKTRAVRSNGDFIVSSTRSGPPMRIMPTACSRWCAQRHAAPAEASVSS
jgi:hypothetical protein